MGDRKTVLVQLSHGMQARNFLYTSVLGTLIKSGVRIIVVAPEYKIDYYKRILPPEGLVFEPMIPKHENWATMRLKNVAINLLWTETVHWWRETRWSDKKKTWHYWFEITTSFFGRFRVARSCVRWLFSKVVNTDEYGIYFQKYKIDAVLLTDIYAMPDVFMYYAAKRSGVPTAGFVRSWDNVTSKGTCLIKPDYLLVHNEQVKDEAISYIGIKPEVIYVTGLPHFDYYHNYHPSVSRADLLQRLGLPANSRFILFANASGSYAPIVNEMLEILDGAIVSGALPSDLHIVFRFAPNHTLNSRFYRSDRIVFDQPGTHFTEGAVDDWEISHDDMLYMADCLTYASITLNFASTMTIDAAALDRPVINIAFDGYKDKDTPHSLRKIYRVTHFQSVLASGGTPLVKSPSELIEAINAYLEDESRDREGRERMAREQCYRLDGKSGERTAGYILSFLKERCGS